MILLVGCQSIIIIGDDNRAAPRSEHGVIKIDAKLDDIGDKIADDTDTIEASESDPNLLK